eukprot:TRINITY_DN4400_c0_g2_i1.p1 TRINITY_DN4400_c0_g2~~TRINITY_DN4400_c0_g2_i1.p1  ORF type:complete len:103 (-),score=41.53 TRINITY_DN4400_c0_g2_i1:223-507(-)
MSFVLKDIDDLEEPKGLKHFFFDNKIVKFVKESSIWSAKNLGKAAWILGTTFAITVLPLILELEREAMVEQMQQQQQALAQEQMKAQIRAQQGR